MALTNPFDVTTPAGSDSPTEGDDRIRELKLALQERNDKDHYWELVGDVVDEDNVGLHRKVTLLVGSAPSLKANAGIFYVKDVGGKAEAFYIDEDGDEVQITSEGALATSLASGDYLLTSRTGAISGFSEQVTSFAGKYMRIGATAETTGGNATHTHGGNTGSHVLTTGEMPAHSHTMTGGRDFNVGDIVTVGFNAQTTSDNTGSTGGGGGHAHTISSADNDPVFVDVRMYKKD